jgi:putative ABC transport system substrate-binding protein
MLDIGRRHFLTLRCGSCAWSGASTTRGARPKRPRTRFCPNGPRALALFVLEDALIIQYLKRIVEFAIEKRLPTMFGHRDRVEAGGLMSYGPRFSEMMRRAASQVDKILRGARPADLPLEQPTAFEFVINLKTANALGLTVSPLLLSRADEVIE